MQTKVKTWMLLGSILIACIGAKWPIEHGLQVETVVVQGGELTQSRLLTGIVQREHKQYVVSPKSGKIQKIYAQPEQKVTKGELLIRLDTALEETALARMYGKRFEELSAVQKYEKIVQTITAQSEAAYEEGIAALSAAVEASSVRALCDGQIDNWYIQEGDFVQEGMVVGEICGSGLELRAAASFTDGKPGMYAVSTSDSGQVFVLKRVAVAEQTGMETLIFDIPNEIAASCRVGEHIQVEFITDTQKVEALIPLSAIDMHEKVWYIENGRVYGRELEKDALYGRFYAEADEWWKGKRVVAEPDRYELRNGMQVRGDK